MFTVALAAALIGGISNKILSQNQNDNSVIKIADTSDYSDEPIDMESDNNEDIEEDEGEIALNLYAYHKLEKNETLPLTNISTNTVNLQYVIKNVKTGKVIYESGLISPGTKEDWNASKYLETGTNKLEFYIIPFTENNEECVGYNMAVTIEIR